MIPTMNKNATYKHNIPDMSGGLNLRDGINLINDNQMTDCLNVWYKDGILKTRPRILENENKDNMSYLTTEIGVPKQFKITHSDKITIGTEEYVLQVMTASSYGEYSPDWQIKADLINKTGKRIPVMYVYDRSLSKDLSCVSVVHENDIYFYLYWKTDDGAWGENEHTEVIKVAKDALGEYITYRNVKAYTPLLLTNGKPKEKSPYSPGGTMIEGGNLLSPYYRAEYSSCGELASDQEFVFMEYVLPNTINDVGYQYNADMFVYVNITHTNGKIAKHKAIVSSDWYESSITRVYEHDDEIPEGYDDNLRIQIYDNVLSFRVKGTDQIATTYDEKMINNIEVIAPYYTKDEHIKNIKKVTATTQAIWYGNTSLGLHGGSRLFLSANSLPTEKALVIWSEFENPLYFSENSYTYVGDKNEKITALSRQGSSLIVFKEHSIYSTQYTQGDVTAEELENQEAIDITTRLATFPITMVHSQVGCNCPDTIQLCRNRLVWADKNGKIYTMTGQSQYSERNVFELSGMVDKTLKQEVFSRVCSIDWDGKYILIFPYSSRAYVMDYNSYGYVNVASYNKREDAEKLIPFFIWELPFDSYEIIQAINLNNEVLLFTDTRLGIFESYIDHHYFNMSKLTENTNKDSRAKYFYSGNMEEPYNKEYLELKKTEIPVKSMVTSKMFDFGAPSTLKNICAVDLALGFNNGAPIKVDIISDTRTKDTITLKTGKLQTNEREPNFIENKRIMPFTRLCARVGLKVECDGLLALDSITMKYNTAGG